MTDVKRIAVSGSAGTGKTTLVTALSAMLGIPVIPDVIDEALATKGYAAWADVKDGREAVVIRLASLKEKIQRESDIPAFVTDKSVIDYLAYWDENTALDASPQERALFSELVSAHRSRYDLVLLLPYGRRPIERIHRRRSDPEHQLRIHSRIVETLLRYRSPVFPWPHEEKPCASESLGEQIAEATIRARKRCSTRIGLLAGTFDPPTNAHLSLAQRSLDVLDEVWFCPNPQNPSCKREHVAYRHRKAMLDLVARGRLKVYDRQENPYLRKDMEPRRQLLGEVEALWPDSEFWVIMGADKLNAEPYRSRRDSLVLRTGHIVYARGTDIGAGLWPFTGPFIVREAVGTESSTDVKKVVALGESPKGSVPSTVCAYIAENRLYRGQ